MKVRRTLATGAVMIFLAMLAFSFSQYRLGTLRDYRIMVYLKYWRVIKPQVKNPSTLSGALASKDTRVQTDAAQSIGLLDPDPVTILALRGFIDRPDVKPSAKDVAIWALGEHRVREALPQLHTRAGNRVYDQENLMRALEKIEGRIGRSIWPE